LAWNVIVESLKIFLPNSLFRQIVNYSVWKGNFTVFCGLSLFRITSSSQQKASDQRLFWQSYSLSGEIHPANMSMSRNRAAISSSRIAITRLWILRLTDPWYSQRLSFRPTAISKLSIIFFSINTVKASFHNTDFTKARAHLPDARSSSLQELEERLAGPTFAQSSSCPSSRRWMGPSESHQ
jgi:hypothetical protein